MRYAHILALIDADLDLLQTARQLLAPPQISPNEARTRVPRPSRRSKLASVAKKLRPVDSPSMAERKDPIPRRKNAPVNAPFALSATPFTQAATPVSSKTAPAPDQPSVPEPRSQETGLIAEESASNPPGAVPHKPIVRPQRGRMLPLQPSVSPIPTALRALVPVRPVFIPVEQIQKEQSEKDRDAGIERSRNAEISTVPLTAESLAESWIPNHVSKLQRSAVEQFSA